MRNCGSFGGLDTEIEIPKEEQVACGEDGRNGRDRRSSDVFGPELSRRCGEEEGFHDVVIILKSTIEFVGMRCKMSVDKPSKGFS